MTESAIKIAGFSHVGTVSHKSLSLQGGWKYMSGFNVHPEDLKRYARQIGRAHEDVATAIRYVDKSCGMVAVDAGPLSTLAGVAGGGHGEVLDNVNGALRHLAKLLKHSESEIKKAAEYYQETDMAEARKMDATYPEARR